MVQPWMIDIASSNSNICFAQLDKITDQVLEEEKLKLEKVSGL